MNDAIFQVATNLRFCSRSIGKSDFRKRGEGNVNNDAYTSDTRKASWFDTNRSMARVTEMVFMVLEKMLMKMKDWYDLILSHVEFSTEVFKEYKLSDTDHGSKGTSTW